MTNKADRVLMQFGSEFLDRERLGVAQSLSGSLLHEFPFGGVECSFVPVMSRQGFRRRLSLCALVC